MHRHSWTSWIAAAGLLFQAGCLTPSAPPAARQGPPKPELLDTTREPIRAEWLPGSGRTTEAIGRRHALSSTTQVVLYGEDFAQPEGPALAAWRKIGSPDLRPFRIGDRPGVEIASSGQPGECGLERDLDSEKLAGYDARVDVTLACHSPTRLNALRGARLSIIATDAAGEPREIFLPIAADLAPEWETLSWWVRFGTRINKTVLRLRLIQPGAGIAIARIEMTGRDWTSAANTSVAAAGDAPCANLIAGGDFETGRRIFYASTIRHWPNGDETTAPLPFSYAGEAVVGERSLRVRIGEGTGRIGFGPLDLLAGRAAPSPTTTWHLKFYARANKATTLAVSLDTQDSVLQRGSFNLTTAWQAFTATLEVPPASADNRSAIAAAELVFDLPNEGGVEPVELLLDGVSLTDVPVDNYVQADAIEIGITGPTPLTSDLANLVSENEASTFQIDLTANPLGNMPASRPAAASSDASTGTLALDLLDAWDRLVWTRTAEVRMPPNGKYSEKHSLPLPRGYYRLLATLWSGEPGQSRLISHDEQAAAVISFQDAVPLGNRFGLSTSDGCISGYTTALGAGWVRTDVVSQRFETKPGAWDFAPWQAQLKAAKQANVEVVTGVTLPLIDRFRRDFMSQWLASNTIPPIGLVVSPPAISTRPTDEYLEQLGWVGQMLVMGSPQTKVVCDLAAMGIKPGDKMPALPPAGNFVIGYAGTDTAIPEASDRLLEQIGRSHPEEVRVWDLGVPIRLGGNPGRRDWPALTAARSGKVDPVVRLDVAPDPVVSASRMVRAILIRALAGAQLVCCEASALNPPATLFGEDTSSLHERDLTPRPALVAFERMTSLLNDATLVRWIDEPDGCRILYFEKDDGGAVAVFWRPFGLSTSYLSFAGLPPTLPAFDCLGNPEPATMADHVRVVSVNEVVKYIVAPANQAALLSEAVSAARIRTAPPQTQPAARP
jgi:hypothetical protein